MTATFAFDNRIIDIRRTEYRITQTNSLVKLTVITQFLALLLGYIRLPQVDIIKLVTNLFLEVDLVFIQSAYYLSKFVMDLFGYLIFGLDMQ